MDRIGRLVRGVLGALGLALLAGGAAAQEGVRVGASGVEDRWRGIVVTVALSGPVPWRVFTLEAPRRLGLELRGLDWDEAPAVTLSGDNATAAAWEAGEGGARLMVELGRPMAVVEAGLSVEGPGATLRLVLEAASEEEFAASASRPEEARPLGSSEVAAPLEDGRFVVAIDPGHGGIDPGAERGGLQEDDLMLALGLELAKAVEAEGMVPVLTRSEGVFVPLPERMTRARAAGADVLLSLHADALEEDAASGASIYTLTREAVDGASERMVARHEGGDLIAGLDLRGQDEAVATALMDLARLDTVPSSRRLAEGLAEALAQAGAAVNGRPLREANLAVLGAADFPSVLIEAGFLSDPGDRARLSTAAGRAPVVRGIVAGLKAWAAEEEARAALLRQ